MLWLRIAHTLAGLMPCLRHASWGPREAMIRSTQDSYITREAYEQSPFRSPANEASLDGRWCQGRYPYHESRHACISKYGLGRSV